MDPPHAPLPTWRNLPFQSDIGSQTSDLMSESVDGVIVSSTRQNAGIVPASRAAAAPPTVGTNLPAATTRARLIVVCGNDSEVVRRSQVAADNAGPSAWPGSPTISADTTTAAAVIRMETPLTLSPLSKLTGQILPRPHHAGAQDLAATSRHRLDSRLISSVRPWHLVR